MGRFVDQSTDVADILQSTADDGEIRVKLGDSRDSVGFWQDAPMWGLDGFFSRPNDPSSSGAAQAFYVMDGNEARVLSTRDNRFASKVGNMEPGDRAIVTDADARVLIKKGRNAVTLYTVSEPDDDNMIVDLDGQAGALRITCGTSWIELKEGTITLGAGGTVIRLDKGGINIMGLHFACQTMTGQLGALAQPPPGKPDVLSISHGPTGIASVGSVSWTVAP